MSKLYDLVIVGSGPGGLNAALYASRAELDFVVIEKNPMSGGQIVNTYEVDNYIGIPGVSGFELATRFRKHCDDMGVQFVTGDVEEYQVEGEIKTLILDNKETYQAKTVIISTGAINRKLGVPGEERLAGMGVSYCATCDGAFFRKKDVVVVGGGDVAVEDAIFLSRLCNKVYVVHRRDEFRAAKNAQVKLMSIPNVEIIWDSAVDEILGAEVVEEIKIHNVKTSESRTLKVEGIFIAVGNMPSTDIYKTFLATDESGYIKAGEDCVTSMKGVFAVGDVRTKAVKQIITAAADGANAITSVERYLNEQ